MCVSSTTTNEQSTRDSLGKITRGRKENMHRTLDKMPTYQVCNKLVCFYFFQIIHSRPCLDETFSFAVAPIIQFEVQSLWNSHYALKHE